MGVFCHAGGIFLFCCLNRGFEGLMDWADFFGFLVESEGVKAHFFCWGVIGKFLAE